MADNIYIAIEAADKFSSTFDRLQSRAKQVDSLQFGQKLAMQITRFAAALGGASFSISVLKKGLSELLETQKTDLLLEKSIERAGDITNVLNIDKIKQSYESISQLLVQDSNRVMAIGVRLAQQTGLGHDQIQELMIGMRGLALSVGEETETISNAIANAFNGRTAELRRYGIVIDENMTKQEKYNALVEQLGGHIQTAINYSQTLSGQTEMLNEIYKQAAANAAKIAINTVAAIAGVKTIDKQQQEQNDFIITAKAIKSDYKQGNLDRDTYNKLLSVLKAKSNKEYVNEQIEMFKSGKSRDEYTRTDIRNVAKKARQEYEDLYQEIKQYREKGIQQQQQEAEAEKKRIEEKRKQEEKEAQVKKRAISVVTELLYQREEIERKQNIHDEKALQAAIEKYAIQEEQKKISDSINKYNKERQAVTEQISTLEQNIVEEKSRQAQLAAKITETENRIAELAKAEEKQRIAEQEAAHERTMSKSERKQAEKFERWSDEARARGNIQQAEKYAAKAYDMRYGKGAYERKTIEDENEKLNRKAGLVKEKREAEAEMKGVDKNVANMIKNIKQLGKHIKEIDKAIEEITKSKK